MRTKRLLALAAVCSLLEVAAASQQHEAAHTQTHTHATGGAHSEFDVTTARTSPGAASPNAAVESAPENAPPFPPYTPWSSGFAPLDEYVVWPTDAFLRGIRAKFRGFIQALRDVLFPEYRHNPEARRTTSPIDRMMADETQEDYESRLLVREWLLTHADAYDLPRYSKEHPDGFRYALAAAMGVVMLLLFFTLQCAAGVCARGTTRFIFWLTGDKTVLSAEDLSAMALREKQARAAQGQQGQGREAQAGQEAASARRGNGKQKKQ